MKGTAPERGKVLNKSGREKAWHHRRPVPTKSSLQNQHKAQQQQRSLQQQVWQDGDKSSEEEKDDAEESDEELEVTVMVCVKGLENNGCDKIKHYVQR